MMTSSLRRWRLSLTCLAAAAVAALAGCTTLPAGDTTAGTAAGNSAGGDPSQPFGAEGGMTSQPTTLAQAEQTVPVTPAVPTTPQVLPASAITAPLPPETAAAATPRQPRGRLDPLFDAERSDLWLRVRGGLALPDVDNELVRKWERYYAADPAYVQRMTERSSRYLFHIVEEVTKRDMPMELALLPFIESAFNPQAQSRASASGMWQFMPATGRDFELRQNLFRDDRRDVLASTRAALDYLQRLHGMFDDWQLALAAYNWGQGNISKAIDRNRRAGLPTDYENLRMPQETREYLPKLQAMKNIVLRPDDFSLRLPPLANHPFFMSVAIERDIDVALAAQLAGLSVDSFQQLNPQMNKPVILAAGTPQVLLPYDNANLFVHMLAMHRGAMASWTAWVAPRTLKVAEAAQLTGTTEALLRDVNDIPPRMLVKAGSTLLVPRAAHLRDDVAEHIADHAALAFAPEERPLRRVSFKAGKQGDSVAAVAKRYRVSAAQVAQWNGVGAQARFKAGQAVVVMLPAGRGAPTATAATTPAAVTVKAAAAKPVAATGKTTAPAKRVAKTTASPARRTAAAAPAAQQRVAKAPAKAGATPQNKRAVAAKAQPASKLNLAQGPDQAAPR